jgi:hypothetical protein
MNLKRWFAWACLALVLVAEFCLFRATRERDAAEKDSRRAQVQSQQAQSELEELKNSNTGLQAAEISRLRKQNEILTNKLAVAQTELTEAKLNFSQATQQLANARLALGLQGDHLAELQTKLVELQSQKQRIAVAGVAVLNQSTCVNQLRQIDAAKQQWALDRNKNGTAKPTVRDLAPYCKDNCFPVCPAGGIYFINAVEELPTCSIRGHLLPP